MKRHYSADDCERDEAQAHEQGEILAYQVEGQWKAGTPDELGMSLLFRMYVTHRDKYPEVTPARWAKIFGPTGGLENLYQAHVKARHTEAQ